MNLLPYRQKSGCTLYFVFSVNFVCSLNKYLMYGPNEL